MAGNVDNRVVQMRFENRQFERNIAKSKKSLEELKASMNFDETSKGMRRFAESMDSLRFNTLEENIQKLADKFTGLGTIGELVVSQIRRKIEEAARSVSGFVESMTTAQVGAGKSKFEMLNKSVQTIKAATGETEATVYSVLKRLNDYTDQTSYNFADMAQNIGKFTSVGIDLRAAERQMEGIANWAARSGAGIAEASRAMYNLSQAMGVGKLTKIDWKSIENASMATKEFKEQLIAAAVEAGTLVEKAGKYYTKKGGVEVNYKNVADTLAKGWATNTVVSATLEKYYWDDLLYQQEETFNEMLANDKKISSSEWKTLSNQKFATDELKQALIDAAVEQGNLVKTVENGKPVYKTAAKYGKEIEVSLENIAETLDVGWLDNLVSEKGLKALGGLAQESYKAAQKCLTFSDVLGAWKDQISTGWMNTYTHIFGELSESMEHFSDICNAVAETIDKLITFRNKLLEGWADLGGRKSLWSTLLGSFASDAEEGAYGILDVFNSVGEIVSKGFWDLLKLFAPGDIQSLWDENDGAWRMAWLKVSLMETTDALKNFVAGIRDFFNEEIKVGDSVKTRGQMIQETVLIFAGAVKMVYDVVEGFVGFFVTIGAQLGDSFDAILGFLSELGLSFYDSADAVGKAKVIPQFFSEVAEILKPVTSAINGVIKTITELLSSFFKSGDATNMSKSLFGVIGEYLKKFFSFVSNTVAPMIEFIGDLIGVLKDLFSGGFGEENLAKTGKALTDALKRMSKKLPRSIQKIVGFFKTLYENITNVIKNRFSPQSRKQLTEQVGGAVTGIVESLPAELQTQGKSIIDKIGEFFKNIWDKITGFFKGEQVKDGEPKESLLDRVVGWLRDGYNKVATYIQTMVGNLQGDAASFGTALKNLNWSKILMYLFGGLAVAGIAVIVAKAVAVVKTAAKAVNTVCDILTGKKGIMPRLFQVEEKAEGFSDKVLKISEAIGILAAAMILIGNMELGDAIQGGVALIVLLGLLVGVSALMTNIYKGTDWEEAVGIVGILIGMTAMGLAVARLAKVILPIANMEWDDVIKMILTLGVIFGGLIWLATLSKDGNMSAKSMGGVAAVAGAVAILVFALKGIADMKPEQIWTMLKTLFAMLLEFIGFVWAVQKASLGGKGLEQLAAVAGAIAILVFALKAVSDLKPEQYLAMFVALTVILAELWGFIKLSKGTSLAGKSLTQLIALTGAIAILMIALLPLSLVPFGQLMGSVLAVGLLIVAMYGFTKLIKNDTLYGSGLTQLLALAGALVLIVVAMLPLCMIPIGPLMKGVLAIGVILGILIGMMAVIGHNKSDNWKSMVALIAVAGAVALLATALMPLALMEWEPLIKMGAALVVLMGSLIALVAVTQKADAKSVLSAAVLMGVMSLMILAFGSALHQVKDVNWELVAVFAGGLAAIIGLITLAVFALKDVDLAKGLKVILFLAAGLAALGLVVAAIGPLIMRNFGSALADISADLSFFALMIGQFTSRMSSADGEEGIGKAENIIDRLMGMMQKMSGFGQYSGSIRQFQVAMFELGTGVESFYTHTKDVKSLADNAAFAIITGLAGCADDLETITKLPLTTFRDQLAGLGGAMSIYAEGAKEATGLGVDETPDISNSVALMKAITEAFNAESAEFTIPKNMPSEDKLSDFGVQLAALAGGMKEFEKAGRGMGDPKQSNAIKTLEFFMDLQEFLKLQTPQMDFTVVTGFEDQLHAAIQDTDTLSTFGMDIEALGSALKAFATSTSIIDEETGDMKPVDFSVATGVLQSFIDIKNKLPDAGGALQALIGEKQSLTDLGIEINAAAAALNLMSVAIQGGTGPDGTTYEGFKEESIGIATKALKRMARGITKIDEEMNKLPDVNAESYGIDTKEANILSISKQMSALGPALNLLSTSITGGKTYDANGHEKEYKAFDPSSTSKVVDATGAMVDLLNTVRTKLPRLKTGLNWFWSFLTDGEEADFDYLASQIKPLGEAMNAFGMNLGEGFDAEKVKGGVECLNVLADVMATVMTIPEEQIFNGVDRLSRLDDFINGLNGISPLGEPLKHIETGEEINPLMDLVKVMSSLSSLILQENIDPNAMEMFKNVAKGLNDLTKIDLSFEFTSIGENIANGIAEGIRNGTDVIIEAGVMAIGELIDAVNRAAMIKSPSRLFMTSGEYMSEGMAIGFENNVPMSENAAIKAVDSTMQALKDNAEETIPELEALDKRIAKAYDLGLMNEVGELMEERKRLQSIYSATMSQATEKDIEEAERQARIRAREAKGMLGIITDTISMILHPSQAKDTKTQGFWGTIWDSLFGEDKNEPQNAELRQKAKSFGSSWISGIFDGSWKRDFVKDPIYKAIFGDGTNSGETLVSAKDVIPKKSFIRTLIGEGLKHDIKKLATDAFGSDVVDLLFGVPNKETMQKRTTEVASYLFGSIGTALAEEFEGGGPTITPVLDLSQAVQEWTLFHKGMTDPQLEVNGSYRLAEGLNSNNNNGSEVAKPDYTGIYERMNALGEQINQMGESIKQMKIVMDSGVVAGAVVDDVDRMLGRRRFYSNRMN